jgi:DNA-binding FadR family transcriptional regulator
LGRVRAVKSQRAAELVADRIRAAIIRGDVGQGDSLSTEAELTRAFSVSRPTLREAMRILEADDLIEINRGPRGGAKVKEVASSDFVARAVGQTLQVQKTTLRDVYEARCAIEPAAARLAALSGQRVAAAQALRDRIAEEYAALGDVKRLSHAVGNFHRTLLQWSGNKTLALLGEALHDILERHLLLIDLNIARWELPERQRARQLDAFGTEEKLADLIERGDGEAAESLWRTLLTQSASYWLQGPLENATLEILETPNDGAPWPASVSKSGVGA